MGTFTTTAQKPVPGLGTFASSADEGGKTVNIDPRIMSIMQTAAASSPYNVIAFSGVQNRASGTGNHPGGYAVDVYLQDPSTGKLLTNYGGNAFKQEGSYQENYPAYEQFAQTARQTQQQLYPDLGNTFRWGGYFNAGRGNTSGPDLMHFDITPAMHGEMGGGTWDDGASAQLQKTYGLTSNGGLSVARPQPPMNIPEVGSAYANSTAPVTPAQMDPALAAIQSITDPNGATNWDSFYNGITSPQSAQASANPQLTDQASVDDFYKGIIPQVTTPPITDQASANNFYQGFGLSPQGGGSAHGIASTPGAYGLSPSEASPQDAATSLAMNPSVLPFTANLNDSGAYTGPSFDAGLNGGGSIVPYATANSAANFASPPVQTAQASLPSASQAGSILNADFGALPSIVPPAPSLGGAYGSSGLNEAQRNAMLAVPSSSSQPLYYDPGTGQGDTQLPAGIRPDIPDVSGSGGGTAPYQSSAQNYMEPQTSGSSSYAMNSAVPYSQTSPGADLSSLDVPSSIVPKYIDVQKQVPIASSLPIEQGSGGVTWDPTTGQYTLGSSAPAAPQYKTETVQQLNPKWAAQAAAMNAYTAPPVAYGAGTGGGAPGVGDSLFGNIGSAIGNAFAGTPLGHIASFLQGQQPVNGRGILGALTGLMGNSNSTPVTSAITAAMSPASQLAANPGLAANQNPLALAAIRNNQTTYSPGSMGGTAPTVDINGNVRNTYGDATNGIGSNQSLTGV